MNFRRFFMLNKVLNKLDILSLYFIMFYILFLILKSFEEVIIPYDSLIDNVFKMLFVIEVSIRVFILKKSFFKDRINLLDSLLLVISFIPSFEMLRVTRLFTYFLRKPEMKKMLMAFQKGMKEIKYWTLIIVSVSIVFSLFLEKQLGYKYPELWGNFFLSIQNIIVTPFSLNEERFFLSVTDSKIITGLFVIYFGLFIGSIVGMINTVVISQRNNIDNEELEKNLLNSFPEGSYSHEQYHSSLRQLSNLNVQELLSKSGIRYMLNEEGPWSEYKRIVENKIRVLLNHCIPVEFISSFHFTQQDNIIRMKLMGEEIEDSIPIRLNIAEKTSLINAFKQYVILRYGEEALT